ncbi:MAG: methyltransferase [Alphaproteobacteria bacterium]
MRSKWKKNVAQRFDMGAKDYNDHSAVQSAVADSLAKDLPDFASSPNILEIGCGTGALTRHLLDHYQGGYFHITDISAEMVEHARREFDIYADIEWGVMDGEYPDIARRYDLIIGSMAFQWFEDIEGGLARLRGLLKPNGVLLYAIPGAGSFREWHAALSGLGLSAGTLDFKAPSGVYREEERSVQYDSTLTFLRDMKRIGAHTPRADYTALNAADLRKACRAVDADFNATITWHIVYGRL